MRVRIKRSLAKGTVAAPPSKSMSHRLLICAGLSEGRSRIHNIAPSQDVLATLDCLKALGAEYTYEGDTVDITGINPRTAGITIDAEGHELREESIVLHCRECGSTLRFFIPLCLMNSVSKELRGSERLLARPMSVYEDLCADRGFIFDNDGDRILVEGHLMGGEYVVPGDVSSQFISGLLFALPLCKGDSRIILTGRIESRSYIDMTLASLREFGVKVYWEDDRSLVIQGDQSYEARDITVEGDYSNAAFLEALNLCGGRVVVTGLKEDTLQGDSVYIKLYRALKEGHPTISLADCPDLGPVLFAMAAIENGATFTEVERLRIKESDRIRAMKTELAKFGIELQDKGNVVEIPGGWTPVADNSPIEEVIDGYNDHRIVMAIAVLMTKVGGEIEGAQAISKSYPDFFEVIRDLGVDLEIIK